MAEGIDHTALRPGDVCEVESPGGRYFTVKILLTGHTPVGEEVGTQDVYDLRQFVIHKINGRGLADACKYTEK